MFNTVGQPMCEAVLQGFNSTIFAYGQTGAGKTHTMLGSDESGNPLSEESGLIPRVFHYIFARIEEMKAEAHVDSVVCKCSYLEIYNEARPVAPLHRSSQRHEPCAYAAGWGRSCRISCPTARPTSSSATTLARASSSRATRR